MREIRIAWRCDVIHRTFASIDLSDRWVRETPEARQVLEGILQSALNFYGPETHWIETRADADDA